MYTYTKRNYTNQGLHYVVNAKCIGRYTIMLLVFNKVDIRVPSKPFNRPAGRSTCQSELLAACQNCSSADQNNNVRIMISGSEFSITMNFSDVCVIQKLHLNVYKVSYPPAGIKSLSEIYRLMTVKLPADCGP